VTAPPERFDLVVVGAGPAGLAAAMEAARLGLSVVVLDEQPAPGGQIWRAVEGAGGSLTDALGPDYRAGAARIAAFRASGADYRPQTLVWQVERDGRVMASRAGAASVLQGERVLLALGAIERPVPIPGWTLPGVMTVGAAQILLKTAGALPEEGVWVAGQGPLVWLYGAQVAALGGRVAGVLDTAPPGAWRIAARHLPAMARAWAPIAKGLAWRRAVARAGIPVHRGVTAVEALGEGHIARVRWQSGGGAWCEAPARGLLLHEGVVPNVHATLALGCAHAWDAAQACFRPVLDGFGRSGEALRVLVAGDAGGILGAAAAEAQGRLAALAAAADLGRLTGADAEARAVLPRRVLAREKALRAMLDALLPPRAALAAPADDVVLCRCEGVTAGALRLAVALGAQGPNQAKAFTRAGMGPCQGRSCMLGVVGTIAAARGVPPAEIGPPRVRPPLKPLTLGELATLAEADTAGLG
jgi:NADPH-dependent 2,4-dienoyl-CoA reductase/sulfur reductase-like enzyme